MLRVQVRGVETARRIFDRLEEALDPEQIAEDSARIILRNTRDRFQDEIDPDGQPWIPSRRVRLRGGKTLLDTGRMFSGLELVQSGLAEYTVTTDAPYATFHQTGTRFMPKRQFLGVSQQDETDITQSIVDKIVRSFR